MYKNESDLTKHLQYMGIDITKEKEHYEQSVYYKGLTDFIRKINNNQKVHSKLNEKFISSAKNKKASLVEFIISKSDNVKGDTPINLTYSSYYIISMPINILDIFIRKYGLSNEEFITMIISVLGRKANDHKYNVTFADRILSMDTVTEFSHMQSGEYQLFPLLSELFRAIIVIKLSRINDLKLHDVLKPETVLTGNEIDTLVDLTCYCYMAFCDRRYALDKRRKVKEEMQKPFRNH